MKGWQCPNCGSAHAPDVKTCPVSAVCEHNYVTDTAGQRCVRCGKLVPVAFENKTYSIDWDERAKYWLT